MKDTKVPEESTFKAIELSDNANAADFDKKATHSPWLESAPQTLIAVCKSMPEDVQKVVSQKKSIWHTCS